MVRALTASEQAEDDDLAERAYQREYRSQAFCTQPRSFGSGAAHG